MLSIAANSQFVEGICLFFIQNGFLVFKTLTYMLLLAIKSLFDIYLLSIVSENAMIASLW